MKSREYSGIAAAIGGSVCLSAIAALVKLLDPREPLLMIAGARGIVGGVAILLVALCARSGASVGMTDYKPRLSGSLALMIFPFFTLLGSLTFLGAISIDTSCTAYALHGLSLLFVPLCAPLITRESLDRRDIHFCLLATVVVVTFGLQAALLPSVLATLAGLATAIETLLIRCMLPRQRYFARACGQLLLGCAGGAAVAIHGFPDPRNAGVLMLLGVAGTALPMLLFTWASSRVTNSLVLVMVPFLIGNLLGPALSAFLAHDWPRSDQILLSTALVLLSTARVATRYSDSRIR